MTITELYNKIIITNRDIVFNQHPYILFSEAVPVPVRKGVNHGKKSAQK